MVKVKSKTESTSARKLGTPAVPKSKVNFNLLSILVAGIAILVILVSFGIKECRQSIQLQEKSNVANKTQKIFWFYSEGYYDYHLQEVFTVLYRLGFQKGTNTSDWDLLWAFNWPFDVFKDKMKQLKPYQKVNHIPGTSPITTKVMLATSGQQYIPPAFRLPKDKEKLFKYSKENPKTSFVMKDVAHRNIKIAKIDEIDIEDGSNFIQEFVDKPLLVDGYKFDIGLYTIITSVDPLRVYIYNGDIMLRFCTEKYYPFDSNNLAKYVIGDDYLPVWKVPGLDYYYNTLKFSKKETLNAYLEANGIPSSKIWQQAEDAIAKYILAMEHHMKYSLNEYPYKRNFFEMVRFDFVIDEDLKVWMLESNMSPNLSALKHEVNKLLYYQILYNVFGLVGVADRRNRTSFEPRSVSEEEMLVSDKNIVTFPNTCNSKECQTSCASLDCQLCKPCMTKNTKEFLEEAFREYIHRGDCKRIYPPPMTPTKALEGNDLSNLTPSNKLQYRWFEGKCIMDNSWC